mmetsp:Transcript_38161/g.114142  ORF Transcript_38161/g.114142 Transcript_38161/m.114142 type:complete len:203 (-) Transcript_38161:141-749(-)
MRATRTAAMTENVKSGASMGPEGPNPLVISSHTGWVARPMTAAGSGGHCTSCAYTNLRDTSKTSQGARLGSSMSMLVCARAATSGGWPRAVRISLAKIQSGTVGKRKAGAVITARRAVSPTPTALPAPKFCGAMVSMADSGAVRIMLPATLNVSTPRVAAARGVADEAACPICITVSAVTVSLAPSTRAIGRPLTKKRAATR